ncbi:PilN domain-containing protein [Psychrobium sp. 1_MG-2023]|uniref:PilN domain-containing protein n=1 Tax=Psychrobium sp. 1_MG-2023 TaxID=3062624 RepID=UPI000C3319FE|nr:PilN domain-containing protein [Psychrobium sp. 1_MG-2023]MDP2560868.1 PilN domain-containing protein [Psychrobium sp. 1_MG-2023]PKF56741.1 hypothetical protein CW748_09700 [Alteromonadales bacterium alter-6D02]
MKTRINLYLPELRPVKEKLPLSLTVAISAGTLALIIIIALSLFVLMEQKRDEMINKEHELVQAQIHLGQKITELTNATDNTPLLNEIATRKAEITTKKRVLAALSSQFSTSVPYSPLFKAFAELDTDNVWLTKISKTNGLLNIAGSASTSRDIPRWVEQLKLSPIFSGQTFNALEIERDEQQVNFVLKNPSPFVAEVIK